MKRMLCKSTIIHMIGCMLSGCTFYSYNPFAIGCFGAIYGTDIVRFPAIFIMGGYMLWKMETMMAVKYIIMMCAISAIVRFCESGSNNEEKKYGRNTNIYFSAVVSGLIFILLEMADTVMSEYTYEKIVMNVAAGVLVFALAVIFGKAFEMIMFPGGFFCLERNNTKQIISTGRSRKTMREERGLGKLNQFAKSLEKLSKSVDELAFSSETKARGVPWSSQEIYEREISINNEQDRMIKVWKNKIEESRKAVALQLREMAFMINEFSKEEYEFEQLDYERERYIRGKLKAKGVTLKKIALLKNRRGITEVVITVKGTRGKPVTIKEFTYILEEGTGKPLRQCNDCRKYVGSEEYTYNFTEETNFLVIHGSAKAIKGEEKVSGDNFAFMELGTGQALMSLSDGMGSGFNAYRDSETVIELLEELLSCGFSEDSAIRLINSVFMINSETTSPATVDMGIIDMYSGMCDFVKLGAASTFVKRGKWVEVIKSTSLPMGVMCGPDMESTSKKLYDGDYVIMVSDGILDSIPGEDKEKELGKIIMDIGSSKPKDMADKILREVMEFNNNEPEDDMTVLVAGIWERCA